MTPGSRGPSKPPRVRRFLCARGAARTCKAVACADRADLIADMDRYVSRQSRGAGSQRWLQITTNPPRALAWFATCARRIRHVGPQGAPRAPERSATWGCMDRQACVQDPPRALAVPPRAPARFAICADDARYVRSRGGLRALAPIATCADVVRYVSPQGALRGLAEYAEGNAPLTPTLSPRRYATRGEGAGEAWATPSRAPGQGRQRPCFGARRRS